MSITMAPSLNVFGEKLISCSEAPMTGFFRDGCCNTSDQDAASHTICAGVTAEFLAFSKVMAMTSARPVQSMALRA